MPRRKLIEGDRVKITGPWRSGSHLGENLIGKNATVHKMKPYGAMPVKIHIDGTPDDMMYHWCRENLRALPRKK